MDTLSEWMDILSIDVSSTEVPQRIALGFKVSSAVFYGQIKNFGLFSIGKGAEIDALGNAAFQVFQNSKEGSLIAV